MLWCEQFVRSFYRFRLNTTLGEDGGVVVQGPLFQLRKYFIRILIIFDVCVYF